MATERLDMRRTREILRLKWEQGLTHREVQRVLGVGLGSVGTAVSRAQRAGLTLEGLSELDDVALEELLYGRRTSSVVRPDPPPPERLDVELRRPGVTLELLHLEYLQEHPDGYRYTAFCNRYKAWKQRQSPRMRQHHRAGEKAFVDYAGVRPEVIDRVTGEVRRVELFVMVLGASNYTYVEASETQRLEDWTSSHAAALEYFGGAPKALVPDQLKSGVAKACSYEPLINQSYADLARHYGCVVMPARPAKPRDKAKVEVAVQIAERWILGRLRHERFFSLGELNVRIRELLEALNARPMKKYGGKSRRELFDEIERAHLGALPEQRYELARWKKARVNIDHHVEYDKHYYSVPYQLTGEQVEVRATAQALEVFHAGRRVASHRRGRAVGGHTTLSEHMSSAHRAHLEWSPSRLTAWAEKVGPCTKHLVESILSDRPHPEMGYRSCLGILRLERRYGSERLEAASKRALGLGARSYRPVHTILKNGLDRLSDEAEESDSRIPDHENVRGAEYYQ